jgi:hypothetical protein
MYRSTVSLFSSLAFACTLSMMVACSSSGSGASGTGGQPTGSGGSGSGGSGSGGSGSGGSGSGGSGSGGTATGGSTASGGSSATGGSTATGGTHGTGGVASGGTTAASGGNSATGGSATGGTAGMSTSGGSGGASGGMPGSAGAKGSGGAGGSTGSGGQNGSTTGACAGKSYKLCDDFEAGMSGAVPTGWTTLAGYGSGAMQGVGLSNANAHSGMQSLQSSSSMTGQARVQRSLSGLGATASKHWGRIFYKVGAPPVKPASGVLHVTMVSLQGTIEDRVVDIVEDMNGKHQWLFNVPDDSCCTSSTYDWSFDSDWHCAEWYVDASSQSYRFFTDGTEVTSIGFTNRAGAKMSTWTSVGVGAIFYQAVPSPFVMWFDDLAIDDNQIGCK